MGVLIADHAIVTSLDQCTTLDLEESAEVLKQFHLESVVLRVILYVSLMILKILHNVLLLSELSIEEFGVALELIGQAFVRSIEELGFISDSLEECVVNFVLDIVRVIS